MKQELEALVKAIKDLPLDEKVSALNEIRSALHEESPFKEHPVDLVLWVPKDLVHANDYNPNVVAPPEMELLAQSILCDGYTQPIVSWDQGGSREVIDGFHRNRVGKEHPEVSESLHGYLPVVTANQGRLDQGDRMASTIRHNRARGKHKITAMAEIVRSLVKRNWSDQKIAKELGMEPDEVLRFRQIGGLAEVFNSSDFSQAWDVIDN